MSDKEIEVNGKKYGEDTQITLKAKTLIWIIGLLVAGISTLATIGYRDMKNDIKNQKEMFNEEKQNYMIEVNDMIEATLKEDRKKRLEIIETIGEMKGDIKVILDRTSRTNTHTNSNNVTPVNNSLNIPSNNNTPTLPTVNNSNTVTPNGVDVNNDGN